MNEHDQMPTPAAATKRIVLVDNIKTSRFSWSERDALITCYMISGHRMYFGDASAAATAGGLLGPIQPSSSLAVSRRGGPVLDTTYQPPFNARHFA